MNSVRFRFWVLSLVITGPLWPSRCSITAFCTSKCNAAVTIICWLSPANDSASAHGVVHIGWSSGRLPSDLDPPIKNTEFTVASGISADACASTLLAKQPGFSLHVTTTCEANRRHKLEKLCRYITRAAIANQRLATNERRQVAPQAVPKCRSFSRQQMDNSTSIGAGQTP